MYRHPIGELSRGAVLDVGLKCTHSCRFCYYSYLDKSDDQFRGMRRAAFRSLDECKAILDGLKANGFLHFDYTGGEPSLHPHIVEITRYAHQELGLKGRMITLGQFLMKKMPNCRTDRLVDDLLDAGLVNFLLSVHAVDEDLFKRATNESWERLRSAMNHLDARGFDYCSNTTVFEWNHRELPAIAREIVRHRVYLHNFILMNAYYEWNSGGKAFGVQARYDAIRPYLTEAIQILHDHGVGVNIRYAPMCGVRGLERHLVGVVGVRYDAHEWMNEAGHFGGTPAQCAARLAVEQGGVDAAFRKHAADETLPNGVRIVARRGSAMKAFPAQCGGCAAREVCDGVDPQYLAQHGADEFVPYQGPLWRFPVHEQRAAYPIPFMVKTAQDEPIRAAVAEAIKALPAPARDHATPSAGPVSPTTADTPADRAVAEPAPRVSVVIPCYNYARYLPEAVASVLAQTFTHFEIVIVDDGSTDDSLAVAKRLAAAHPDRIRVIAQPNAGQPAISRNRGIAEARGAYVLCLDADDKIAPTMLERCVALLETRSEIAIAYTDRRDFDGVDAIVQAGDYDFSRLRFANHISYCALFRRAAWEAVGGYRTNVKGCEDWDLWVAAGARGYFGARIPEPLFWYRRHDTGVYQEALQHFAERQLQIVLNNREAYPAAIVAEAERALAAPASPAPPVPSATHANPVPAPASDAPTRRPAIPGLVSVIVPTRDRPMWLRRALASILAQRWRPLEVIVVNDAGADVGPVVAALDTEGLVTVVRLAERRERSVARNAGLGLARGEFVAYLDDDDWWDEDHLTTLVPRLQTSDAGLVYSDPRRVREERRGDGYVAVEIDVPYQRDFDLAALLVGNYITTCSAVHRRACTDAVGGFDETLSTHEDWDLWIRIAARWPVQRVPQVTCNFSWREDGTSTTSARAEDFRRTEAVVRHRHVGLAAGNPAAAETYQLLLEAAQIRFGSPRPFDVSIVLPVGSLAPTRASIEAIAGTNDSVHFEVVLVDDGTEAATSAYLATLGGDVRIVRESARNEADAWNAGARAARGRFLLFLRNGSRPEPEWLGTLVDAIIASADVAVVGGLLRATDGAVRHAGVSIGRDGGTPRLVTAPVVAPPRRSEPQAVSGGMLLVRREAFATAGGFDPSYDDYLADVDLCLAVRAAGGRVVYEPRSIALADVGTDLARPSATGVTRLRARWGARLVPDEDAIYAEQGLRLRRNAGGEPIAAVPFRDADEARRWALVASVQRRAHRHGWPAVADALCDPAGWPNDPAVLEWAARVACPAAGVASAAPAFARRAALLASEVVHEDVTPPVEATSQAPASAATAASSWESLARTLCATPDDDGALDGLLQIGMAEGRWRELVDVLAPVVARMPDRLETRFALAHACLRIGRVADARGHYELLRAARPTWPLLHDLGAALASAPTA